MGTTVGNYIKFNQNGLTDVVSFGYQTSNQLNYNINPITVTSNINCQIGTVANPFNTLILNGKVTITPQGQINQPLTLSVIIGPQNYATLPPYLYFQSNGGGTGGVTFPTPSAGNSGQRFTIRQVPPLSLSPVNLTFSCVGGGAYWALAGGTTLVSSWVYGATSVVPYTFVSANGQYVQI